MSKRKKRLKPFKRSTVPTCENSIVDLRVIRKQIRDEMQIILRQAKGNIAIILDLSLMKIINCVFESEELNKIGVKHIYGTHQKHIQTQDCMNYFFFVRVHNMSTFHRICTQIRLMKGVFSRPTQQTSRSGTQYSFMNSSTPPKPQNDRINVYVYCIPRKTKLIEFHFERNGLLCRILKVGSFGLDLIPIDVNLLTLSLPKSFYQISYLGNTDVCYNAARAVIKYESMYGHIPRKRYIGVHGKITYEILAQLDRDLSRHDRDVNGGDPGLSDEESSDLDLSDLSDEDEGEEEEDGKEKKSEKKARRKNERRAPQRPERERGVIDELIIIDRAVDLITPLMTPLVYEALINHLMGIQENGIFDYTQIKQPLIKQMLQQEQEALLRQKKLQQQQAEMMMKNRRGSKQQQPQQQSHPHQPPPPPVPQLTAAQRVKKMILNHDDEVFRTIRFRNIMSLAQKLTAIVNDCKNFENKENYDDLEKMKTFMAELPRYQQKKKDLACHLAISGQLKDWYPMLRKRIDFERNMLLQENEKQVVEYIENLIILQTPLPKVLNHMALLSLINFGIKDKILDSLQRELVQSYGIEMLIYLKNLRDAGIVMSKSHYQLQVQKVQQRQQLRRIKMEQIKEQKLQQSSTTSEDGRKKRKKIAKEKPWENTVGMNYVAIRKKLGLFTEEESLLARDIHYVFTGYGALSVRLIQEMLKERVKTFKSLDIYYPSLVKTTRAPPSSSSSSGEIKNVMVFFVGGISRAEICTLRFIQSRSKTRFLICATEVFGDFLEQFTVL